MVTALGAVTTEAPQWQQGRRGGDPDGAKGPSQVADSDTLFAATVQFFLQKHCCCSGRYEGDVCWLESSGPARSARSFQNLFSAAAANGDQKRVFFASLGLDL